MSPASTSSSTTRAPAHAPPSTRCAARPSCPTPAGRAERDAFDALAQRAALPARERRGPAVASAGSTWPAAPAATSAGSACPTTPAAAARRLARAGGRAVLPGDRRRTAGRRAPPSPGHPRPHGHRASRTSVLDLDALERGRACAVGRRRGRADGRARRAPHRPDARHRRHHPGRAGPRHPLAAGRRPGRRRAGPAPARPPSRCTARPTCSTRTASGIARSGVLVVGPDAGLPALHRAGAAVASARPASCCAPRASCSRASTRPAPSRPAAAALKGDLRMADVVAQRRARPRSGCPPARCRSTSRATRSLLQPGRRRRRRAAGPGRAAGRTTRRGRRSSGDVLDDLAGAARAPRCGLELDGDDRGDLLAELRDVGARAARGQPAVDAADAAAACSPTCSRARPAGRRRARDPHAARAAACCCARRARRGRRPTCRCSTRPPSSSATDDADRGRAGARPPRRPRAGGGAGVRARGARACRRRAQHGVDRRDARRPVRRAAGRARTLADRAREDRTWTFGHVVVDEAQELSPMQWRLIVRRVPVRSMTVVGDVAQTGSAGRRHRVGRRARPDRRGPLAARGADGQLPDAGRGHGPGDGAARGATGSP